MYRITALWVSALLIILLIILFAVFLAPFAKIHVKHYQKTPRVAGLPWQTNVALVCRSLLTNNHPAAVYFKGDPRLPAAIQALQPLQLEVHQDSVTILMEKGMHPWNYYFRPGSDPGEYLLLKQTSKGDETLAAIH